jgi:hypothetical protein
MVNALVAAVSAAVLIGAAPPPANAWRGGDGGGFRGGEPFEHFHSHDRFRGPRFFGGFGLGLGLGPWAEAI